jgi:hypothetical protein
MCRTFHVCNPTSTPANRWLSMRDIALLGCGPHCCHNSAMLDPSSLKPPMCPIRPSLSLWHCSDLTPTSRSVSTGEQLQIPPHEMHGEQTKSSRHREAKQRYAHHTVRHNLLRHSPALRCSVMQHVQHVKRRKSIHPCVSEWRWARH